MLPVSSPISPRRYATALHSGASSAAAAALLLCHASHAATVLPTSLQMVGHVGQLQQPGDFFCGTVGNVRYLVAKGEDGAIRAFHNVSIPVHALAAGHNSSAPRGTAWQTQLDGYRQALGCTT